MSTLAGDGLSAAAWPRDPRLMYEIQAAIVGNVVTEPVRRQLPSGEEILAFRLANTSRRFDQTSGQWVDAGTMYLTVSCRRRLIDGVESSVHRGDPVIAYGSLRSSEYTTRDGVERNDLEMRATAVGPDLGRCTAAVQRKHFGRAERPDPVQPPAADADTAAEPATTHS
ncbi:single-stranded DNA-binding protein [Nocardia yamanashiensis]|uniref:single-stranded DNA-binding protein n=1 Tax=Nocardia yamanashiensis TaxID=209247 RepID=UPI001F21F231|nr:single-stranded DNA-binding protein [Nocardia yamanashiensis]